MQAVPAECGFKFRDAEENVVLMTRILLGGKLFLLLNPKSYHYLFDPICLCGQSSVLLQVVWD